jgi:hypothetical protein
VEIPLGVSDTNMKQLGKSNETKFVGHMYCNVSAAIGTLITIKEKCLNFEGLG